jgi:predicted dehydrogenase
MKGIIKMGVIGLGAIAQAVHIPGILKSKDLELAAICDIDVQRLKEAAQKYGIDEAHCFTDYHDLIKCNDVDALSICTPNDEHFQMAMDAASARKPYACEKPVTMNAMQADELAVHTKMMGVPNMVCFSYRFKAAARYAKNLIERDVLGEIYHADMQYFQSWGLPDANCGLVWRFIKARTGSGALGDLGCHALDLVRFVTGKEYVKVVSHAGNYVRERRKTDASGEMGISDVDDYCNYLAELEGATSASFQITRFGFGRGNYQRMELYGSKGSLIYKLDENPNEDELEVCIGRPAGETHTFTKLPIPEKFQSDQMQSFADILHGFSDGMAADIEDARINQHVVDAVITSFEEERWVKL